VNSSLKVSNVHAANSQRRIRAALVWEGFALGLLGTGFLALQVLTAPSKFVGPDTWKYLQIAGKQAQGNFWFDPSAFDHNYWPIGYPTFLAIQFDVLGEDTGRTLIIQAIMALALVLITWGLAFRLGRTYRLCATVLVVLSPAVWTMARIGGYEILLALLLNVSLLLVWTTYSTAHRTWVSRWGISAFSSGLVLGAATLVQNKAIVVLPVLLFLAWKISRIQVFLPLAGLVFALLPWSIRNLAVFGTATPFNNNGPINVWIGNNPDATTGGFMEPPPIPPGASGPLDAAIAFIVSQPEAAFALMLRRLIRLLEPTYVYFESIPITVNILIHYLSILITSAIVILFLIYIAGRVWRLGSAIPNLNPLAAFVILYYLVHIPFLSEPRYMSPVSPVMVVIAVATLGALVRRWLASRKQAVGDS
jgi:hypothetical protein